MDGYQENTVLMGLGHHAFHYLAVSPRQALSTKFFGNFALPSSDPLKVLDAQKVNMTPRGSR